MKNIQIHKSSIILLLLALTVFSCSEDFLEEPKNTSGINENVVFTSPEIVQAFITGIYANYKGQWDDDISDGVNNSNVDTGGLYAMYFARTIKGNDLIQAQSWFGFDYAHENREPNYRRTIFTWFFNYQIINYANTLITGLEESNLAESVKREYTAVAKAIRAYHHFQIALEFAPNYNNDRNLIRLPIYREKATGTSDGNTPVALSELFDFVITDLNEAIADLPDDRPLGKSYINKAVAQGILARVLLVTQDDWAGASAAASAAYGGDADAAVVSTGWTSGFNSLDDQDWLWGHFQDGSNETNFFWMSPSVMMDHLTLSYQATYANTNFVSEFSATDVRNLFFDIYGSTTPYREFVSTKFAFTFDADVPLMRKSEMVLIDAEAQYHLGNETPARELLFSLQSERDPNAVISTNTGAALLNEILLERRKELYGELGVEWFDAKRYNLPINRDVVHRVDIDVPADSDLFFLKIPQDEIDANPNIDDSINN